jgi:Family of unknown function (DUF5681)
MPSSETYWKKGVSGNPGGRRPIPPDVKLALEAMTPRAVERLAELLESSDESVAIRAVSIILDRTYGKAAQGAESTLRKVQTALLVAEVERRYLERADEAGVTGPPSAH